MALPGRDSVSRLSGKDMLILLRLLSPVALLSWEMPCPPVLCPPHQEYLQHPESLLAWFSVSSSSLPLLPRKKIHRQPKGS